jgi:protein phosphatase methylesterase 1
MSDLLRSAISARVSKLPPLPAIDADDNIDDEEENEENDSIGDLPGSGLGPPAMQVNLSTLLGQRC